MLIPSKPICGSDGYKVEGNSFDRFSVVIDVIIIYINNAKIIKVKIAVKVANPNTGNTIINAMIREAIILPNLGNLI
jgi:hypothetical protein